ncbi:MAG: alpha/beta hydrolase [Motilibacteraceae bacterium]
MSTPPFVALPAGTERVEVATGWGALAALEARPDGAVSSVRAAALLVPGFTGSKEDFIAVLPLLAQRGVHVIAVDQRGQHESPHATDPADYDVAPLGRDALAAAAVLRERSGQDRVHLLGHSFGGLVARAATLQAAEPASPHRDLLASLTLLCSGPADVPEPGAGRLRLLAGALAQVDLATIWAVMRQLDAENGVLEPAPDVQAFLERRWLATDAAQLLRVTEQLLGEPDRTDALRAAVDDLGLPVLVARGEDDDAWAHDAQADMARRLGARHEVIAQAAHSPAAERPETTADLLATYWVQAQRG